MTRPPPVAARRRLYLAALVILLAACRGPAAPPTPASPSPPAPTPPDRPPPLVQEGLPPAAGQSAASYLPLAIQNYANCAYGKGQTGGTLTGQPAVWQPLTLTFDGPAVADTAAVNPFLDYRLNVQFVAPSGRVIDVPGYFGGGAAWQAHFAADEPGQWRYCA